MQIPIFTDDAGWHGAQLKLAFKARGVDAHFVSLQDCLLVLAGTKPSIQIPASPALPKAAFVRGIAGGSMQQVVTRLNVLHILAMQGVMVYNDVKAIERTVDKAMTSFLLASHGVMTPATWVCESRQEAEKIRQDAHAQNRLLVIKPLFGSQGLGVRKLPYADTLPVPMQQYVDGVYYFQQLIRPPIDEDGSPSHDYRVFVIRGKVVACMKRTGAAWLNNLASGGQAKAFVANQAMVDLALAAASALDIDYCGVDIMQAQSGEYYVLEVNSIPAWKGLQSVCEQNIAQLLVDDFLAKLP
ncbi:MAG: RimK family alpha-L-glutamate ligase [Methylotenera sp.]|nr:RimK family alpha-L-glutamate ligase [Methylotenera sp.]